jgi:hypothetical protein
MTSKIKVDNIENQCGGAVVTKCGATTTISGSVVKADNIQAADGGNLINQCGTTITLGASGDTINLAAGASQTGFGRTGTVDWDTTPKTATFSAVSGNGYFVNTTAGVITVNLPAGSAGAIVSLADYAATWQTSNVTITPNGSDKIGGENENATLDVEGQSVTFVYVDSTQGWINTMDSTSNVRGALPFIIATGGTVLTNGDFKTHVFTGPGTFCVSRAGPADYFVVAGGGGTNQDRDSGGGAGGFRLSNSVGCVPAPTMSPLSNGTGISATIQGYPIVVGGGGAAVGPGPSNPGSSSSALGITSAGGGGSNQNGGSGGGGRCTSTGGSGNTPPVSPPQGNPGGTSGPFTTGTGGGGGAGAAGTNGGGPVGGPGGAGSFLADTFIGPTAPSYGTPGPVGSTRYFAGGGGGAKYPAGTAGAGGVGGGGAGAPGSGVGTSGTTNTGGGAGGSGANGGAAPIGASGGSGIVIIRYKFQ